MNEQVNNRMIEKGETETRQGKTRPRASTSDILQPPTRTRRGLCQQCGKPIARCECQPEE